MVGQQRVGRDVLPDRMGRQGGAIQLASSSLSLIDLSPVPIEQAGPTTWSLWVKTNRSRVTWSSDAVPFFVGGTSCCHYDFSIGTRTTDEYNGVTTSTNAGMSSHVSSVGSSVFVEDGKWHHLAVTSIGNAYVPGVGYQEPGYRCMYIDGVQAVCGSMETATGSVQSLYLGRTWSGYLWDGVIDDIRVYTRILSASELQALTLPVLPRAPLTIRPVATAGVSSFLYTCSAGYGVYDSSSTTVTFNEFDNTWVLNGAVNCVVCPRGTFSTGTAAACSPCAASTYGAITGLSNCTACPPATTSLGGTTSLSSCLPAPLSPGPSDTAVNLHVDAGEGFVGWSHPAPSNTQAGTAVFIPRGAGAPPGSATPGPDHDAAAQGAEVGCGRAGLN